MHQQYGMKWFVFYSRVRPWMAFLSAISLIVDFFSNSESYSGSLIMVLYVIFELTDVVMNIIVFKKSFGDFSDFVTFAKVIIWLDVFTVSFQVIALMYQMSKETYGIVEPSFGVYCFAYVITFIVGVLVWCLPNSIYFEKRRRPTEYSETETVKTGYKSGYKLDDYDLQSDAEENREKIDPENSVDCIFCKKRIDKTNPICTHCGRRQD